MKSGNLNFLEPTEPLQACDGTALPGNRYFMFKALKTIYKLFYLKSIVLPHNQFGYANQLI